MRKEVIASIYVECELPPRSPELKPRVSKTDLTLRDGSRISRQFLEEGGKRQVVTKRLSSEGTQLKIETLTYNLQTYQLLAKDEQGFDSNGRQTEELQEWSEGDVFYRKDATYWTGYLLQVALTKYDAATRRIKTKKTDSFNDTGKRKLRTSYIEAYDPEGILSQSIELQYYADSDVLQRRKQTTNDLSKGTSIVEIREYSSNEAIMLHSEERYGPGGLPIASLQIDFEKGGRHGEVKRDYNSDGKLSVEEASGYDIDTGRLKSKNVKTYDPETQQVVCTHHIKFWPDGIVEAEDTQNFNPKTGALVFYERKWSDLSNEGGILRIEKGGPGRPFVKETHYGSGSSREIYFQNEPAAVEAV